MKNVALVSLLVAPAIEQDLDQGGSWIHAGAGMQDLRPRFVRALQASPHRLIFQNASQIEPLGSETLSRLRDFVTMPLQR